MNKHKLFLIDGSAIFYRSYFAFIRNPLINSKGENTSSTFGFLNTLFKIIEGSLSNHLRGLVDNFLQKRRDYSHRRHKLHPSQHCLR